MQSRGVVMVAYGERASRQAEQAVGALLMKNSYPVHIIAGNATNGSATPASRRAKLSIDGASPFDLTAYLDADTRPNGDISAGFDILADGWDIVLAPSDHQGAGECLWHVSEKERKETLECLGYIPLQLQAGVMFVRKSDRVKAFFEAWRDEYERYHDQDQAAMLRALHRCPVKIWLLGRPWNGGAVIAHLFGRCRQ